MATETLKNEEGFAARIADGICLACFNTPWSAACRAQIEILDQIADRYGDRVKLLNVNVDRLDRLSARYDVHHIPTVIFFCRGRECRRLVGLHPETDLCRALEAELSTKAG